MKSPDYGFMLASKHIGSQFLKMYQNQWKGAMVELGPTGDEKKNIAYLLHILERAYLFSANMAPRFADVFEQALFSVSINIQESNDIQFLVRQILDQLSDCMKQTFLQEQDLQHDAKINPAVGVFIGEAVALCWLMVIQSPRVYLSTTIPKKFDPELFEPYSHSGSEVDFVVWPVIKLSDNEGPVICRGKAVLKSLEA